MTTDFRILSDQHGYSSFEHPIHICLSFRKDMLTSANSIMYQHPADVPNTQVTYIPAHKGMNILVYTCSCSSQLYDTATELTCVQSRRGNYGTAVTDKQIL